MYNDLNLSVARFAARNESTNEAIKCVFFSHDKSVATDGFRLIEVTTSSAVKAEDMPPQLKAMRGFTPFLVPAPCVSDLKKMKRGGDKNSPVPALNCIAVSHVDDTQIEFASTNLEVTDRKQVKRGEGRFPEYQNLFPAGEPRAAININALLLSELLETMGKIKSTHDITLKIYADNKPIVLEAQGEHQKARALVMPIRTQ